MAVHCFKTIEVPAMFISVHECVYNIVVYNYAKYVLRSTIILVDTHTSCCKPGDPGNIQYHNSPDV